MQVSKDTPSSPDELAALTKPLEPIAKRVPKKQLKEKASAPAPEDACNGQSKIWGLHRLYEPLKFG